MNLHLRLAWRNLWRHRRRTWLTVGAMIFSNIMLVFLICLQFGSYDMMINNTLLSFSGHMQVQRDGYNDNPKMRSTLAEVGALAQRLRDEMPELKTAARAMGFALVSSETRSYGLQILGVQPLHEPDLSTIPGLMTDGRFLKGNSDAEIVLGSVMARNLKASTGDELVILGSGRDGSFAAAVVTVVGVFDSGLPDLDREIAEVPLGFFQDVFAMENHGHVVALAAPSLDAIPESLSRVETILGPDNNRRVLSWEALHPGLKQAIQADLSSAWFMYMVLIVMVSLSVLNTQLMSVMERTREFGTIMALGVKPRRLAALVVLETVLMGLLGLTIGGGLGWLLSAYLSHVGLYVPGLEEMMTKFNVPDRVYPSVTLFSILLGPAVVFAGCLLAAIYPALRLFRLKPVEAMRSI